MAEAQEWRNFLMKSKVCEEHRVSEARIQAFEMASDLFSSWATGFSGCDGGDIGSKENPSIWFCGIEWAGGHQNDKEKLLEMFSQPVVAPPEGYGQWRDDRGVLQPAWKANLAYRFNWQAVKLLSAFNGGFVKNYKRFAEEEKPFTEGGSGYFKLNLYPLAFKSTSHALWGESFAHATGFEHKKDYIDWIRKNRFPVMRDWARRHKPKAVVCTGITYANDFCSAFAEDPEKIKKEVIENRELQWLVNDDGCFVFVIPFMGNPYGLTKNVAIQAFGERMRAIVESASPAI